MKALWLCAVLLPGVLAAESSSVDRARSSVTATSTNLAAAESGLASFYADKYHGRPTASGEIFDNTQLTAAHRKLPFGTLVKVTHTGNNRSIAVRINDRGPFVAGRIIDLSRAGARQLRMEEAGLAQVKVEILAAAKTKVRQQARLTGTDFRGE